MRLHYSDRGIRTLTLEGEGRQGHVIGEGFCACTRTRDSSGRRALCWRRTLAYMWAASALRSAAVAFRVIWSPLLLLLVSCFPRSRVPTRGAIPAVISRAVNLTYAPGHVLLASHWRPQ